MKNRAEQDQLLARLAGIDLTPMSADELAIIDEIDKRPEGLGDTLKNLLAKIGAEKAAKLYERLTGCGCGCEEWREWLNKWWPYNAKENTSSILDLANQNHKE